MAGAGYKLFQTGDVLTATEVNTYLQQQVTMVFANSTARTTALSGVLAEGMMSYLQDTNTVEVYNGSSWVNVGNTGDITGVTAGTGISGGGTSGDVTITNSMATAIDAKGDLIVGTGSDTFSRLAVGTNGHTLVADSSTSTGLKWAAAGGKILQVVQGTQTTGVSTTSTSYVTTNLTASITPASASNKVLIIVTSNPYPSGPTYGMFCTVFRGTVSGTNLATNSGAYFHFPFSPNTGSPYFPMSITYLDSPSTTSSQTYTFGIRADNAAATVGTLSSTQTMILMEVAA